MIKHFAIYGLDGTLVDSSHRYRTVTDTAGITRIDLPYWRGNEHRAGDDSLLPLAAQYRRDLLDEYTYVIIATARTMNGPGWRFVDQVLGKPDYLISRRAGDDRSGGLLKVLGLQKFFNLKNFRDAEAVFYEDNAQYLRTVCDHFRIRGVYIPSVQGH